MLDEEFGAENFIAEVQWQKADSARNDAKGLSSDHDTTLVYQASNAWAPNRLARTAASDARFSSPDGDPRPWFDDNPSAPGTATHQGMVYAIQHPITGVLHYPAKGRCWTFGQANMLGAMSEYALYELRDINIKERARVCGPNPTQVRAGVQAIMLAFRCRMPDKALGLDMRLANGLSSSCDLVVTEDWDPKPTCRPRAWFRPPGGATT